MPELDPAVQAVVPPGRLYRCCHDGFVLPPDGALACVQPGTRATDFGLYGFIFNPFIYAMLGSSPQMVIGPEAAGSLLVGTVVKASVDSGGEGSEDNDVLQAQICGVVGGMAGAIVLVAGRC